MSMFGMLDCAKNYKNGYRDDLFSVCHTIDDENQQVDQNLNILNGSILTFKDFFLPDKTELNRFSVMFWSV